MADLKERINSAENILQLTPFSEDQWQEVITRGTIHLPDEWMKEEEGQNRTPIHAKVRKFLALIIMNQLNNPLSFSSSVGWHGWEFRVQRPPPL